MSKFYITTPIYYINNEPHLGHAYTTLAADVACRWHKLKGEQVFFSAGTDEHGEKNAQAAQKNQQPVQAFADAISAKFIKAWQSLNIDYSGFLRTTDAKHKQAVAKALERLYKKGLIYKGQHQGLYCLGCEQYKTAKDLVNGCCPDHQQPPIVMSEDSYMFKLSQFSHELASKIKSDELKIRPRERRNEILSFYQQGLKDISFSRQNVKWGVALPWDKTHTAYVWPDAFLNYLTVLGWDGQKQAPQFFPPQVQLMSKDILRVHATIWPAMLLGLGLPLPKKIFVHGFFTMGGQKMSKSLGNVVKPQELIDKFSVDGARYLILASFPFGSDGDISWPALEKKYQADLCSGLGNLVSRSLALCARCPTAQISQDKVSELQPVVEKAWQDFSQNLDNLRFCRALETVWSLIKICDVFIEKNKPWELTGEKLATVLLPLQEVLRQISWMLKPFMPKTSEVIWQKLGILKQERKKTLAQAQQWQLPEKPVNLDKNQPLFCQIKKSVCS